MNTRSDGGPAGDEPANPLDVEVELRRLAAELATEHRRNRQAKVRYTAARAMYEDLRIAIAQMQSSKFWTLRQRWFEAKARMGRSNAGPAPHYDPPPMEPFDTVASTYDDFLQRNAFRETDRAWMTSAVAAMRLQPRFSIIVPTYNTPESYLRAMLDSVLTQVYPYWQLCIADDASTQPHVRAVLEEYRAKDQRVTLTLREANGHISAASNSALETATGEFIALLDHDDVITPDALFHEALRVNATPDVDMIYSDEDKINDDGRLSDPFFKPDWSPDRFLCQMYTSHFGVYRTSLVREIGGFRLGFEGSQDYDLVLRLTERTSRVEHVPRVLYHWRIHPASTTAGMDTKPYAEIAAKRAIAEALERRGEPGTVESIADLPGSYTIRYHLREPALVSIVIPTRDHGGDVDRCLRTIFEKTEYPNLEVILIDNGSRDHGSLEVFAAWERREPNRLRVIPHDVEFNYSAINNFAVRAARGPYVLFLNNDTEIITPDWLTRMMEQAQRPEIGGVGAKLLYGDGRIQHGGVVLGVGGLGGHSHRFFAGDHFGYYNVLRMTVNQSAVTAACLLMRRSVFDEVGGFDEDLRVAYNDVDLCLRIVEKGYRIVYVGDAVLYHYESQSRGYDLTPAQIERDAVEKAYMERRWRFSTIRDPYYNPNLTLLREDFSLAP
jgi:GT2 family glycosyltransferase